MRPASVNLSLCALLVCAAAAAADAPGAEAQARADSATSSSDRCDVPVCVFYARLEAQRNHIVLYQTQIIDTSRGVTRVKADQAEGDGLSLDDNRWLLTGHVQISNAQAQLRADRATVVVTRKQISSMNAQGAPAEFERNAPGDTLTAHAHGHADQIDYDLEHNRILLRGDSWLSDGCNELTGQRIQYDIASQRIEAEADASAGGSGDERVHGTIRARSTGQCTGAAAAKP